MTSLLNILNKQCDDRELLESSLSRFLDKFSKHDAAVITAYRSWKEYVDDDGITTRVPVSKAENQNNNKTLFAALYAAGYSITSVLGSYIEHFGSSTEQEVAEHSFVVVNIKDTPDFHETIIKLGIKFVQDSVLLINKGEKPTAFLYGTSHHPDAYPSYGAIEPLNKILSTIEGQEFFTRLRNTGFAFINEDEGNDAQEYHPKSGNSIQACKLLGKRILSEL